jgi:hypothetical protein
LSIRKRARAEARSGTGRLRFWAGQKLDDRPFLERPTALVLYDFYFDKACQLERLDGVLSDDDVRVKAELEDLFTEKPEPAVLDLVERAKYETGKFNTGDPVLDRYYAMLDRGEVPDSFWGPNGPPAPEE